MAAPPGGYRLWADRLREAHEAARSAARRLGSDELEAYRALRHLLSGIWVGPAADHFAGLLGTLDRRYLHPLADDLARLAGRLEPLWNQADQAASAESAGLPVSPDLDLVAELHQLRRWAPAPATLLPAGWERPPGGATQVSMDTAAVRALRRRLDAAAAEVEEVQAGLAKGFGDVGIEVPPLLPVLASSLLDIGREVGRRAEAMDAAMFETASAPTADLAAMMTDLLPPATPGPPPPPAGDNALVLLRDRFEIFDTAAKGGRPDGKVSKKDLEAVRDDAEASPEARDLARRLLESPTFYDLVANGKYLTHEKIRVFLEENRALRTVMDHYDALDTAAKGGTPDGYISIEDLKAAADSDALAEDVRAAARWLLDHAPAVGGIHRNTVIARLVDGQAYAGDPQAAKRFVESLPVATDGKQGLDIRLCSTDGVKALANAALLACGGDLTDQQSVIAHLPETTDAVRNELITAFYDKLAQRVDGVLAGSSGDPSQPPHPGLNWLAYAPWASNAVHEVIDGDQAVSLFNVDLEDRQAGADGNQWIFNDITARFAAFVELYEANPTPSAAQLEAFFAEYFSDGEAEIRKGFLAYAAAKNEPDPVAAQRLVFQANILVATHEQAGVHPYLGRVGSMLLPDRWEARYIDLDIGGRRIEVNKDIPPGPSANNHVVAAPILDLDPSLLDPTDLARRVGLVDLAEISGIEGFPTSIATWYERAGGPDPDGLAGSNAPSWKNYEQRMWSIHKLFEQTHTDPRIFETEKIFADIDYSWLDGGTRVR